MEVGIIADDLTGAADAAAPFARRGRSAFVNFGCCLKPASRDADVVSVDTETRSLPPFRRQAIVERLAVASGYLARRGAAVLVKKIDSTLRGHLRLELEIMRRRFPDRIAIVCPAFPAVGRSVMNGELTVHGIPWRRTDFARGNDRAVVTVQDAFGMRYNPSAAAVPLDRLRAGVAAFEADLDREIAGRARTLFVDAETSADLGIIAEAVLHRPSRFLPVGSAGLCTALAEKAADVDRPPDLGSGAKTLAEGRVLVVVGSLHQASRAQAKRIAGRIGTHAITVGPGEEESAARQTLSLFGAGGRVVLATTPGDPGRRYQASLLKRFAQSLLQGSAGSLPFDGLVLTGGETALQICRGLRGLQGIAIVGEIEPGVVRATLRPEEHGELGLALKAGGFGDEGALCRCAGLE